MGKDITYEKAPLVELIVEVRWPVKTIGIPGAPPIVGDTSATFDLWFQRLASSLREEGYQELERLVSHDTPPFAHQPVFRFRRPGERFPIFQFGHGIFTVNAGPPNYVSWQSFRPTVQIGLDSLIRARPEQPEPVATFTSASLRYIDSFGDDLRNGVPNFIFMRDELGVTVSMPQELLEMAADESAIAPTIALKMQLKKDDKATLTFQVAEGRVGKATGSDTIMDMVYAVARPIQMDGNDTLRVLDRGYEVVHEWFEKLTKNITDRMKPVNCG